jgi:hypothetical protein
MIDYPADLPRDAAFELINGRTFHGRLTLAFFQLPDDYLDVGTDKASVALYTTGGNEGYMDRTDRLTVEVHAPGTAAVLVAEAISSVLVNGGMPHDLDVGYVDEIRLDVTPYDVPFPGGGVNQARAVFLVTYRPTH